MHRELLGTSSIKKKRSASVFCGMNTVQADTLRFARIREEEYLFRLPVWSPPQVAPIFFFLPGKPMFWRVQAWMNPWPNC